MAFLGDGKLKDDNSTSTELRQFLAQCPFSDLQRHARFCLEQPFNDSGFVLQDVINEIGTRLGFSVLSGHYRGNTSKAAPDGIWSKGKHYFVVEVKTTDAYRIDLDRLEFHRKSLIQNQALSERDCSILLIVGREDTGGLEAQIRGSQHAWSTRLLSVEGLLQLLQLRANIDSDDELAKISDVLVPREYTKVDNIIGLVFSATQTKEEEVAIAPSSSSLGAVDSSDSAPQERAGEQVQNRCLEHIKHKIHHTFVRNSPTRFHTAGDAARLVLPVSRPYEIGASVRYWFAFHTSYSDFLDQGEDGWAGFGCGFDGTTALLKWEIFKPMLQNLNQTVTSKNKTYWHVFIVESNSGYHLRPKSGFEDIDLTAFMIGNK